MAKDEPAPETEEAGAEGEATAPAPAPKNKKKVIAIAAAAAVVVGGGGGAWLLMKGGSSSKPHGSASADAAGSEHAEEHPEGPPAEHAAPAGTPNYLSLTPAFVVNLADTEAVRYLQVDIELMSHDAAALEQVKTSMPLIRNNLLMIMGQQHIKDIETREGKEKLQAAALAEIQRIVAAQNGSQGIEALYFTSFVVQ